MNPWLTQLSALWLSERGIDSEPMIMPDGSMRFYVTDMGMGKLRALPLYVQDALKWLGAWPIEGEA